MDFYGEKETVVKKSKGLIIAVIMLSLILVCLVGYILYDEFYVDKNNLSLIKETNKKYEDANKKYEDANKMFEDVSEQLEKQKINSANSVSREYVTVDEWPYYEESEKTGDAAKLNVYAIKRYSILYAKEGKFYLYSLNARDGAPLMDTKNSKLIKDVNESDISKVKLWQCPSNGGQCDEAYFIYKDGRVKKLYNAGQMELEFVFNNYKVKDITVKCGDRIPGLGKCKGEYVLTLQDGSTVTQKVE